MISIRWRESFTSLLGPSSMQSASIMESQGLNLSYTQSHRESLFKRLSPAVTTTLEAQSSWKLISALILFSTLSKLRQRMPISWMWNLATTLPISFQLFNTISPNLRLSPIGKPQALGFSSPNQATFITWPTSTRQWITQRTFPPLWRITTPSSIGLSADREILSATTKVWGIGLKAIFPLLILMPSKRQNLR